MRTIESTGRSRLSARNNGIPREIAEEHGRGTIAYRRRGDVSAAEDAGASGGGRDRRLFLLQCPDPAVIRIDPHCLIHGAIFGELGTRRHSPRLRRRFRFLSPILPRPAGARSERECQPDVPEEGRAPSVQGLGERASARIAHTAHVAGAARPCALAPHAARHCTPQGAVYVHLEERSDAIPQLLKGRKSPPRVLPAPAEPPQRKTPPHRRCLFCHASPARACLTPSVGDGRTW